MNQKEFLFEIESDPNNLNLIEDFLQDVAEEFSLQDEKLYGILLTVSEAVTNAIIHANKQDKSKKVTIKVIGEESSLRIAVTDEGPGFNPREIPDPTKPENLLKDSGRGLYLMRVYADDVQVKSTPEGTTIILLFNF